MTEERLLEAAQAAVEDGVRGVEAALDQLVEGLKKEGEVELVLATHECGHILEGTRQVLLAALAAIKELRKRRGIERLTAGGDGA
jgi:hypothetical protein